MVKKTIGFWWVKPNKENEDCFIDKELSVNYNNGVFSFLHSDAANAVGTFVRFTPNLVILSIDGSLLFDGCIVIDYYVESTDKISIKDELVVLSKDAHDTFIQKFEEKEAGKKLRQFAPEFDHRQFREKLSLIQSSYFEMQP